MAIPLQKTKLFIPPARPQLVERQRLIGRMNSLRDGGCRVALISAPAGSGKTTLIVQWLASQGLSAGWLSLDERDNHPERFFTYLISALQAAAPGEDGDESPIGQEALALIGVPGATPEEIITLLTNDLSEAPGPFVLVLDDFHTITNPLLHQAVDLLIEAQPPQMRLVLLTREDPGLQLARRRARGQLVELRQADLRFTLAEAVDFLNQTMGLQLTTGQMETLEARTEGWIAGLQMAALALQSMQNAGEPLSNDVERFLRDFSGSQRFILDYLIEEVLARQPAEVQRFLLDTAILERICADLCAAVTGTTTIEAQRVLEHLAKANLFIIPLDEKAASSAGTGWFRYHHLFHDLLRARLQAETPIRADELERRASDWFEANGEPRLAVEFALKAGDAHHAAALMDRHIAERWQTLDLEFHLLVHQLPEDVLAEWPAVCLQRAWMCVIRGRADEILHFVEIAEKALTAGSVPGTPGRYTEPVRSENDAAAYLAANRAFARVLRAYVQDIANQPVTLDEPLQQALAAIPMENVGLRNSVAVVIGTIDYMEGDFAAAIDCFEEALATDKRVNGTNAVPVATARLAQVLQAQGRLHEAERRLVQSEAYVRVRGSRRFYVSGAINLYLGKILLEWNRLEEAEAQIREGLRLLEDWPVPQVRCQGWSLLAYLHTARGNLTAAKNALEQAEAFKAEHAHPMFTDAFERARVRLLIAAQHVDAAHPLDAEHPLDAAQPAGAAHPRALEDWVRENEPQALAQLSQHTIPFRYEARLIELCRAWLVLGRTELAARMLERLAKGAQGRNGSRVAILSLLAAARGQDPVAAQGILDEALRLAEPEGYLRTFVDAGEALRPILETLLQQYQADDSQRLSAYAWQVLAAIDGAASHRPSGLAAPEDRTAKSMLIEPEAQPFVETLSQREREVLQMVAAGLTNQQIADRLVLSVRTVKKHIENIHGKLGVQNRTQAAAKARSLGLLD